MTLSEDRGRRGALPSALSLFGGGRIRREARLIAPYLDTKFYLENNADVAAAGLDASYHYAKYGWREGRDPSPSFSTTGYLAAHPKVALAGTNPLLHFVQLGEAGQGEARPDADNDARVDAEIALVATGIDEGFYRAAYPDFGARGLSAAAHYCRHGWREGKDPSPAFSTSYYLLTNPDIRESGLNPFWHYLTAGKDEGRLSAHPGGWKHRVLSDQTSFEAYCENWLLPDAPPDLLDADGLQARLASSRTAPGLLVSLGHDDYRATPGGVQLCVEIEERDAARHGFDYLNLHPWQPLPKLAEADDDYILWLVLNGHMIGAARVATVIDALSRAATDAAPKEIVIHHLAGHAPERVAALATALGTRSVSLWLHDYFTLCTSYALQRNNITPCNVPASTSNACGICLFGAVRRRQQARIEAMFEALEVDVISPSEAALKFWSERTSLRAARTTVHPHVHLAAAGKPMAVHEAETIRIAFVGTPAAHKGWPVFLELQKRLAADERFSFWFFGTSGPDQSGLTHVETHVRASDPESTVRAIADHGIDLVLHWATWPETFSFSTFEALAGGAFVVTNIGSGNVAATVERTERGLVLKDAGALFEFAASGGLQRLAERARAARREGRLVARFSGMTLDLRQSEDAA